MEALYFSRPYCGPGFRMTGARPLILDILLSMGFMASAYDDLHQLQGLADTALYRAKHLGRNRIEVAL